MGDLEDEKIELIKKKEALEEELSKPGGINPEEAERIKQEIAEIRARIEKINKEIRDAQLGVE
jgi:hypothetical protein